MPVNVSMAKSYRVVITLIDLCVCIAILIARPLSPSRGMTSHAALREIVRVETH